MTHKKHRESESSLGSDKSKLKTTRMKNRKLFKHRFELKIIVDNVDVTPTILRPFGLSSVAKSDKHSQSYVDVKSQTTGDALFSTLTSGPGTQSHTQNITISYSLGTTTNTSFSGSIVKVGGEFEDEVLGSSGIEEHTASVISKKDVASAISVAETKEKGIIQDKVEMPTKINIMLTETPLFYLLEMPSVSAEVGTPEGLQVEKDNEYYDYLTTGKGRNRKTTNAEIQTAMSLLKTRSTYAEHFKKRHNHAFASGWDMLDTYENKLDEHTTKKRSKKVDLLDPDVQLQCAQEMQKLVQKEKFQSCVTVMERVLANNVFNLEQKRFRGLIEQDPFRPDIAFKYNIELLWTFKNSTTEGHPVTSMQWNPANQDILAVGYGKFYYSDNKNGFVFCWNIKNPTQPEREYYPNKPVTTVAFSTFNPNLLAVGLYDGMVHLVDISSKNVQIVSCTSPSWSPAHEPVWQVTWLPPDDYHPNIEYLICVTEDGRVCRLINAKTNELLALPLMRILPIEGQVKGVHQPRHCPVTDVPISRCSAALIITKHSTNRDLYYIGTDEGTIHRCSRNYLNQHIEMFLAHNGPVYSCEFSPFCKKLFLTCGADWSINIWAENLNQPLITLTKTMETVEGAVWCPANSTIIANIAGSYIYLWDLQRRTYLPAASHKSPTNCRNTIIKFTDSGKNLVVADVEGNVNIFTLEDMPFPPFYQAEMLMQVIKKALITRTDLIEKLEHHEII